MIGNTSDKRLREICDSVKASPTVITDEEIISAVSHYLPSYNCEAAALSYFAIIAHICYYRSDVEKPLLKIALTPTVYLGIINAVKAIKWVQSNVTQKSFFSGSNRKQAGG